MTNTRAGGGTRTNRFAHRWYSEFFKNCVRWVKPPKHRVLGAGSNDHYKLARKGDAGLIRLELAGRLNRKAVVPGPLPSSLPAAVVVNAKAQAPAQPDGVLDNAARAPAPPAPAKALSESDRQSEIANRGTAIKAVRAKLDAGSGQDKVKARAEEAALVRAIVDDLRSVDDPATRRTLAGQMLALKLPQSHAAYLGEPTIQSLLEQGLEDAAEAKLKAMGGRAADEDPALDLPDRNRDRLERGLEELTARLRVKAPPTKAQIDERKALRQQEDRIIEQCLNQVPDEKRAPLDGLKADLARLQGELRELGDQGAPPDPAQATEIRRKIEECGASINTLTQSLLEALPADLPEKVVYDAIPETRRALLAGQEQERATRLAQQFPAPTETDAFLDQFADLLGKAAKSSDEKAGGRIIDRLLEQARQQASSVSSSGAPHLHAGDALVNARELLWMLDNKAKAHDGSAGKQAENLKSFCAEVDRLYRSDSTMDDARLQLKKSAATTDAEREFVRRQHELDKAVRTLERVWQVSTRDRPQAASPFIKGGAGGILIDASLLKALDPRANTRVKTANTADVNLLVANAIALQKSLDDQFTQISSGEVVDARDAGQAPDALDRLFTSEDLARLGFAKDQQAELLQVAQQLAKAGMSSAKETDAVNRLLDAARDRLVDNSLANHGLRELAGPEARARALVTMADEFQPQRAESLKQAVDTLRGRTGDAQWAAQDKRYWDEGRRLAVAYDSRVRVDHEVHEAREVLKTLGEQSPALKALDPADRDTQKAALQVQEFNALAEHYVALVKLRQGEAAADEDATKSIDGMLVEVMASLERSYRSLPAAGRHPLSDSIRELEKGLGLEKAVLAMVAGNDVAKPATAALAAADTVVTIYGAPRRAETAEREIKRAAREQSRVLAGRLDALPAAQRRALQTELRRIAADIYLQHLPVKDADGGAPPPFVLGAHREEFLEAARARLGFESAEHLQQALGVEIDDLLLHDIDAKAMGQWISDAKVRRGVAEVVLRKKTTQPPLSDASRAALLGAIEQMEIGERVFLKASRTGEVGLSKLPVDPSGTLKVDLMLGVGDRHMFDVMRKPPSGNYVIRMRAGTTLSARVGVGGDIPGVGIPGVQLSASGKLQFSSSEVAGMAFEFPPEAGLKFINDLLQAKPIDGKTLGAAKEIKTISKAEDKLVLEAGLNLGVGSKGLAKQLEKSSPQAARVLRAGLNSDEWYAPGVSAGVGATLKYSRAWAQAHQRNANAVVIKRAQGYELEAAASAGVKVSVPTLAGYGNEQLKPLMPQGDEPQLKDPLSADAVNVGTVSVSAARIYEAELSVEQSASDGSLRKAEFEFMVPLVKGLDTDKLKGVDSRLRKQLERMSPDQKQQFDDLLKKVDVEDGFVLLATAELPEAERNALNEQYQDDRRQAQLLREKLRVRDGDLADDAACEAHGNRLAELGKRAEHFDLKRLIVVKGAWFTRDQAIGFGLARYAAQGQSGTGQSVGMVDLGT